MEFEAHLKTFVKQLTNHMSMQHAFKPWAHELSCIPSLSFYLCRFEFLLLAFMLVFLFHRLLCHSRSFAVQLHSETNDFAANFAHSPPKISRLTKHKFENIIYSFIFWGLWNGVVFAATARNSYAKKLDENNLLCFR